MIIKDGYWNQFIPFQIKDVNLALRCFTGDQFAKYVVAYLVEDELYINKILSADGDEKEGPAYKYMDCYASILPEALETMETMHGPEKAGHILYALLSPLKLQYRDGSCDFCPIFLYLSDDGIGAVKVRVPLDNVDAAIFMTSPQGVWYEEAQLTEITETGIFQNTDISSDDIFTPRDFFPEVMMLLQLAFGDSLLKISRNIIFDNFVLLKTICPDLENRYKSNNALASLYHICYPGNFAENPAHTKLRQFWKDNHIDIGGYDCFLCTPGRLVIFAGRKFLKRNYNPGSESLIEFLENSIQVTFDWGICIGIWKKLIEMALANISAVNYHGILQNKANALALANSLDEMVDLCPLNVKRMIWLVSENLGEAKDSFKTRIERLTAIEAVAKDQYNEKRDKLLSTVALIFTALFGLPAIHETLTILKRTICHKSLNCICENAINVLSVILWVCLCIYIVITLIRIRAFYKKS